MLSLYHATYQPDLLVKFCVGIKVFLYYNVQKNKNSPTKRKIARSTVTSSVLILIIISLQIYIITEFA